MQIPTILLATLATLAAAAPAPAPNASPNPGSEALASLQPRQSCTPNGLIGFYQQPNYGGEPSTILPITAYSQTRVFCTLFKPAASSPFSFKSYTSAKIIVALYKNAECKGPGDYVIAKAKNNIENPNVNESGYLSYVAVYDST